LVAKAKFKPYEPLGDELSNIAAYVQAATALDRAGMYADETKNSEQLTQIAMVWLEMAVRLTGPEDEEGMVDELDLLEDSDSYPLGFASPEVDAEVKRKREENGK
jgi:hypothetical protein